MQTPTFEWYTVKLVVRIGHQKNTCYTEIGLCVQNKDTFLSWVVDTIERAYVVVILSPEDKK